MSADFSPRRGEVRETPEGRRFYVRGEYEFGLDPGPAGMVFRQAVPLTGLIEVEGRWAGSMVAVATDTVSRWTVVAAPRESVGEESRALPA